MTDERSLRIFKLPAANVRFSVLPLPKQQIKPEALAGFSDHLEQTQTVQVLESIATFANENQITVPEFSIRVGMTELVLTIKRLQPVTSLVVSPPLSRARRFFRWATTFRWK